MNATSGVLYQSRTLALFLDLENIIGKPSGNDKIDLPLDELLTEAQRALQDIGIGRGFAIRRAYANWSDQRLSPVRGRVRKLGLEPVQIYSFDARLPNAADIQIVCDALAVAADQPTITDFVIVSGDGGYVPLVHRLQQVGRTVVVLVTDSMEGRGSVGEGLRAAADHFKTLPPFKPLLPPSKSQSKQPMEDKGAASTEVFHEQITVTYEEVSGTVSLLLKEDASLTLPDQTIDGSRLSAALRERYGRPSIWAEVGPPKLGSFLHSMGHTITQPHAKPTGTLPSISVADDGVAVVP